LTRRKLQGFAQYMVPRWSTRGEEEIEPAFVVGEAKGGRDVVACWNLSIKALQRARSCDGSSAPSLSGLDLDGSPVPFGSTATHDPIEIPRSLWARWKSLDAANKHELMRMSI